MKNMLLYERFNAIDNDLLLRSENTAKKNARATWVRWATIAACLCVVVTGLFMANHFLVNNESNVFPPGRDKENKNISNVFFVNNQLYYIMRNGQFYLKTKDTDQLLHVFPTHVLCWSDNLTAFLYYDERTIFAYNPLTDTTASVMKVTGTHNKNHFDYLIGVIDKYVFLRIGTVNYKANLDTKQITALTASVNNCIAIAADTAVYQSDNYKTLSSISCTTNEERVLLYEETTLPVISACIANDVLFYVRSDGLIRSIELNDLNTNTQATLPDDADIYEKKIIALTWTGEKLICVTSENSGDIQKTSVCLVSSDGSYVVVRDADEPNYFVPGSCIIQTNDQKYAYILTTDNSIIYERYNK